MERYEGGIDEPTEDNCPSDTLNHAVLIVGYNLYGKCTFILFYP